MNYILAPLAAVAMVLGMLGLLLSLATPADASRPVPGHDYRDVCKNVEGDQYLYEVKGAVGIYKFDTTTKKPHDCVPRGR